MARVLAWICACTPDVVSPRKLSCASLPSADFAIQARSDYRAQAGLELRRDGLPLALWNRDVAAAFPDGNIYGSWPFYMDIRPGARVC